MLKNERGSVLVFSYIVVASMVAWGAAAMARTLSEQGTSQRYARLATAFQTAEAGLDQALVNLEDDPDWAGTDSATQVPSGGYYEVDVEDDDSGYTKLTITGHYPTNDPTAFGYQQRQVEAMVELQIPSVFQFGLFGEDNVTIEDDVSVDSYDSSEGAYEDQEAGDNGDVGTNNTEEESIILEGEITIDGQVAVGPDMDDPDDAVQIEGEVTISAEPDVVSQSGELEMPAVDEPDTCNGETTIGDEEVLELDAGEQSEYCYDSLHLEGTGSITVTGNVTVYAGDLQLEDNATVNAGGSPTQLVFQITSANEVKLENNGVFVGAIYAPQSLVKLENNVTLYGAVTADEVKVENATAVHYDEALADVGPSGGGESDAFLVSWREL